jgi:hypothetical protein
MGGTMSLNQGSATLLLKPGIAGVLSALAAALGIVVEFD